MIEDDHRRSVPGKIFQPADSGAQQEPGQQFRHAPYKDSEDTPGKR
jgi:hypothetical protein